MGDIIRRPDLEAQVVSTPDFIGDKIIPFWGKPQIAGRYYFQAYKADKNAQYGRDHAALAEITNNVIVANDATFSCTELRSRISMSYSQLQGYKDKDSADLAMGRLAKRAWFNKTEALIADAIMNPTDAPVDGTADIVSTLDTEITKIRDLGIGNVALVLSNHNKVALKSNATIVDRMKMTGVPTGTFTDIRSVSDAQLAAALGCDEIITGKDTIWYAGLAGADKDNVAIVVKPNEAIDPAEEIQLGRLIYFMWEDSEADKFIMESWHNNLVDAEVVDAKGLVDLKIFNKELITVVRAFNENSDSESI